MEGISRLRKEHLQQHVDVLGLFIVCEAAAKGTDNMSGNFMQNHLSGWDAKSCPQKALRHLAVSTCKLCAEDRQDVYIHGLSDSSRRIRVGKRQENRVKRRGLSRALRR